MKTNYANRRGVLGNSQSGSSGFSLLRRTHSAINDMTPKIAIEERRDSRKLNLFHFLIHAARVRKRWKFNGALYQQSRDSLSTLYVTSVRMTQGELLPALCDIDVKSD
jgi:hypothetical protein